MITKMDAGRLLDVIEVKNAQESNFELWVLLVFVGVGIIVRLYRRFA